jgi:hypothetical protein
MTTVQMVRVMKLAFFFSYSDAAGSSGACDGQLWGGECLGRRFMYHKGRGAILGGAAGL